MTERFIVLDSAASMPGSCWGKYRRVAVVELSDPAVRPKTISSRAKGVERLVKTWEACNVGKYAPVGKCAFSRAVKEAEALAAELNAAATK